MKLIIAGSRNIFPTTIQISEAFDHYSIPEPSEIVSGSAAGVDAFGEQWAMHYGIDLVMFPANWKRHGKAAGPIRNAKMADYADALLLIWNGHSPGSRNMKQQMIDRGKPVYEIIL